MQISSHTLIHSLRTSVIHIVKGAVSMSYETSPMEQSTATGDMPAFYGTESRYFNKYEFNIYACRQYFKIHFNIILSPTPKFTK
jgi:hypothetical protein